MTLKTAPRIGARRTGLIALVAALLSLLAVAPPASAQAGATISVSNV